ncbi:uncharacterized protein LOC122253460 [Penaeus japonicus]|uniref:uncharacterized protein LOC122253460 n=1 Tax=Penaeus japonicus TaxID=27405 RepID=UPI001C70C239|nr:uncharacterized protein LOC122253460 [Penaeus japonicus]
MQGTEVKKVDDSKYLGSAVEGDGGCEREVRKRTQANTRRVSGVIFDRRISATSKGKADRVVVRPAMLYGLETVALPNMEEVEMRMLSNPSTQHRRLCSSKLNRITHLDIKNKNIPENSSTTVDSGKKRLSW